jgi:RNA polymerase sigma-70 factor, ECF subfamily
MALRPIASEAQAAQPALVPSAATADAGDFALVALPLMPSVVRVAQALTGDESDADDLVQETFLRAYRHWHTFQRGSDCRSWLGTICRNAFFENRRRESRSTAMEDHELDSLASGRAHNAARAGGVDDLFARIDLGPAIAAAVARLEPHYRYAVLLIDVDGRTYEEVAELLRVPIGTVRSRLYRGRRQLQESLIAYAVDAGFGRDTTSSSTLPPPSHA